MHTSAFVCLEYTDLFKQTTLQSNLTCAQPRGQSSESHGVLTSLLRYDARLPLCALCGDKLTKRHFGSVQVARVLDYL